MCIRKTFGYCVVAEAGCNWYLRDINIYSLSKNMQKNGETDVVTGLVNQGTKHLCSGTIGGGGYYDRDAV